MPKIKKIAPLVILLVLFCATPVWADVKLDVNGSTYLPAAKPVIREGFTFVELDVLEKLLGAEAYFNEGDNQVVITKNGKVIKMLVGENFAYVGEEKAKLPAFVFQNEQEVMVPLRFVAENLGFSLGWDNDNRVVKINYSEKRDGMSAEEVLLKSSEKMNQLKKYRVISEGKFNFKMEGLPVEEKNNIEMKMNSSSENFYQKEPLVIYSKQEMLVNLPPEMMGDNKGPVYMESLFMGNNYYMRMGEEGWVKMDLGDLKLEQIMEKYNNSNPAVMLQMMKDWGMISVFRDDKVINGNEYWVINTVIDKDKFMNEYNKFMNEFLTAMPAETTEMIKDAEFDFCYVSYINKKSFINEMTEMDMKMKLGLKVPEVEGQKIWMQGDMYMKARITDFDKDFVLPDVSGAVDITQMEKTSDLEK